MPFTIFTTNNARRDIQQAIDWENMRKPGLASYFLDDLNKKLESLAVTPGTGSIRYDNVHISHTKIFSYNIHYTVDDALQQITILRVLHSSRKPV
jgi:plasmid stabilization system protein ParE